MAVKKIKAGGYVRVSTLRQANKGESLETQRKEIEAFAKKEGFKLAKIYADEGISGGSVKNRHALQELMVDASKGFIDFVIVHRLSRLGRNARELLNNVEELHNTKIKIRFIKENIDLSTPYGRAMLVMLSSIAQLEREITAEQSLENRIALAKKGVPTAGKLPFGRSYDKAKRKWSIIKEDQEKIKEAAERFLNNEVVEDIAKIVGLEPAHIYKCFRQALGDEFKISFNSKIIPELSETIVLKVPRLLPKGIEKKVQAKMKRGKMVHFGGNYKHKVLFRKMVFCGHCGHTLTHANIPNKKGQRFRYYVHPRGSGKHIINCKKFWYLPAELFEQHVMTDIINILGDKKKIDTVLRQAVTGTKEADKLEKQNKKLEKDLKKTEKEKNLLIDKVTKGLLTDDEIKTKIEAIREREFVLIEEKEKIDQKLSYMPTNDNIKKRAEQLKRSIKESKLRTTGHLEKMTLEEKRELLVHLFSGYTVDGEKAGVYVEKHKDRWVYTIKGSFQNITGDFKKNHQLNSSDPLSLLHSC